MISGRSGWGGDVGRQPRSLRPGVGGSHRVSLAAIVQNQIVFSWAKGGSHVLCTIHDDARITISQSNDVERIPILGLAGSHRVSLAAIVQNQIVFSWAKGG